MFGAGRPAAAASAAMAPFLVSATGVGYEQHAYVWTGFGVWTQLWASVDVAARVGASAGARSATGAATFARSLLTALTVALHFETGYLALSVLLVWPFVAGRPLVVRLRRAAVLVAGSLLASAWVIVPLLAQREWAATNEILRGTALENGYGAGRVLGWLVSGGLLDHGRLPVVTRVRGDRVRTGLACAGVGRRRPGAAASHSRCACSCRSDAPRSGRSPI